MSVRGRLAWILILPPALFSAMTDHGPPFMVMSLHGPESNHSTIGLVILFLSLVVSPLMALLVGVQRYRQQPSREWVLLGALGAVLFASCLTIQQPYYDEWKLGPGADAAPEAR